MSEIHVLKTDCNVHSREYPVSTAHWVQMSCKSLINGIFGESRPLVASQKYSESCAIAGHGDDRSILLQATFVSRGNSPRTKFVYETTQQQPSEDDSWAQYSLQTCVLRVDLNFKPYLSGSHTFPGSIKLIRCSTSPSLDLPQITA